MIQAYTQSVARQLVRHMKAAGWTSARYYRTDDNRYVITVHRRGCKCGICPHVHDDGYVR